MAQASRGGEAEDDGGGLTRKERQARLPAQNGNGYVPDGYWPPVPTPARSKSYPSGYPYPQAGRKFISYPYPTGNPHPTINPSSHTKI